MRSHMHKAIAYALEIAYACAHRGRIRRLSGRALMTGSRTKCLMARGWAYVPAASGPIGGGLIKLGRGNTAAAVTVGLAPYAVWTLLLIVFVMGYIAALARYLWAKPEEHDAMERLITISANAVVSILTLSPAAPPTAAKRTGPSRCHCTRDANSRAISPAQPSAKPLSAANRPALADRPSRARGRASSETGAIGYLAARHRATGRPLRLPNETSSTATVSDVRLPRTVWNEARLA
jgi:hypothetical protein